MKRIVLTGGGTAGHVMPNLALIPELQKLGWEIHYIGSREGIEKELLAGAGLPYHPIATGKLRRYLSLKNLSDPFRVLGGLYQSFRLLKKIRPRIVFAKGGFVSVPVVIAAWLNRIPVILHESDLTPAWPTGSALPSPIWSASPSRKPWNISPPGKPFLPGTQSAGFSSPVPKKKGWRSAAFLPAARFYW